MIICGDSLEVLRTLPAETIQCCVTSPPYWGLRDYGTAKWVGGDPKCAHLQARKNGADKSTLSGGQRGNGHQNEPYLNRCAKCGAVRQRDMQIGVEKSPDEYVAKLVELFREVRRVLKQDGTLWINLGDSYASGKGSCFNPGGGAGGLQNRLKDNQALRLDRMNKSDLDRVGLKPKDLVGIPWLVAFALRADGWYLRQDIIWAKPNPMPESVQDRCTKAHEYIFLFSKARRYYFDSEAIKEPGSWDPAKQKTPDGWDTGNGWDTGKGSHGSFHKKGREKGKVRGHARLHEGTLDEGTKAEQCATRNKRSVWEMATKPYHGAHFATYPIEIPITCIRAGSRAGDAILDPFAGSGTTLEAAHRLGRQYVGIELNQVYVDTLIRPRLDNVMPLFLNPTTTQGEVP